MSGLHFIARKWGRQILQRDKSPQYYCGLLVRRALYSPSPRFRDSSSPSLSPGSAGCQESAAIPGIFGSNTCWFAPLCQPIKMNSCLKQLPRSSTVHLFAKFCTSLQKHKLAKLKECLNWLFCTWKGDVSEHLKTSHTGADPRWWFCICLKIPLIQHSRIATNSLFVMKLLCQGPKSDLGWIR